MEPGDKASQWRTALIGLCIVALAIFIGVPGWEVSTSELSNQFQNQDDWTAPAGKPGASGSPTLVSVSLTPAPSELLLFNLYNNLVSIGKASSPATDTNDLWRKILTTDLAAAIESAYPNGVGGFVTAGGFTPPTEKARVFSDDGATFRLAIDSPPVEIPFGGPKGLLECEVAPVNATTPGRALIVAGNVQCLYAQTLRNYAITQGKPFNFSMLAASNVEQVIRNYLTPLTPSVISQWSIDLANNSQIVINGGATMLSEQLVNDFATIDDEAAFQAALINSAVEDSFVHLRKDSTGDGPKTYERSQLDFALKQIAYEQTLGAVSAQQAREIYLKLFREESYARTTVTASPGQMQSVAFAGRGGAPGEDPCANPLRDFSPTTPGTTTPGNDRVVFLTGVDHNGALSFASLEDRIANVLTMLNYKVTDIDVRKMNPGDETRLCLLRDAATLLLKTHGDLSSQVWQCYPDIAAVDEEKGGWNPECDAAVSRTAAVLKIPVSASGWGHDGVAKESTGKLNCSGRIGGSFSDSNRCVISIGGVEEKAGTKSVIASGACHAPENLFPAVANIRMSRGVNSVFWNSRDGALLAKDILGLTQYCTNPVAQAAGKEPFFSDNCTQPDSFLIGSSRILDESANIRGFSLIDYPSENQTFADRVSAQTEYNRNGLKKYLALRVSGLGQIEFAPTVKNVALGCAQSDCVRFNSLTVDFSSPVVDPEINVFFNSPAYDESIAVDSPTITERQISFPYFKRGDMPAYWDWPDVSEEQYLALFGFTRANWPYYVEARVSGKAPNGISLIGNSDALQKWIFRNPVRGITPSWKLFNGHHQPGNNTTTIRIPVKPPSVCVLPAEAHVSPDHYPYSQSIETWGQSVKQTQGPGDCYYAECCGIPGKHGECEWAGGDIPGFTPRNEIDCNSKHGTYVKHMGEYKVGYVAAGSVEYTKKCSADPDAAPQTTGSAWQIQKIPIDKNSPTPLAAYVYSDPCPGSGGSNSSASSSSSSSSNGSSGNGSNSSGSNGNGGTGSPCDRGASSSSSSTPSVLGRQVQNGQQGSFSSASSQRSRANPCD